MKLTPEELAELVKLYKEAQTTPVIALSLADGLSGKDFASQAYERFNSKWKEICAQKGINPTQHGFNSETGEIVS